ncbi:hypothetical protein PTKIN_Ptkin18bG0104000 [Pterospermum kingtungense]
MPSLVGKNRSHVFNFLKDRMWKRLQSWCTKPISKGGREILVKAVAQAILIYCMNVFLIPVSLAEEIQRMINFFWWGTKGNGGKGIAWLSWDRLCISKENGGMGFRSLHGFNLAMLGKQGWKFLSSPDTLASRLFKAKYFPNGNFPEAHLGNNPSFVWRGIWVSRALVSNGHRWRVGDGTTVKVWSDPWLRDEANFRITTPLIPELNNIVVRDLMVPGGGQWDVELLSELFQERDVEAILNIPLCNNAPCDRIIWHYSKGGDYTVRSAYKLLVERMNDNSHLHVPREWKLLWNLKLPPKIKHFAWRAAREVLPNRDTLRRRGVEVPLSCISCSFPFENSWHLFIGCKFAQECW